MKRYVLHGTDPIGRKVGEGHVVEISELGDQPRGVRELFDQGAWWRQKDGTWIRVADMADSHRGNTARMLLRRAARHAFAYSFGLLHEVNLMQSGPLALGGDMSLESLDRLLDETAQETSDDPHGWLTRTALFRALTDGLTGDDARGLDPTDHPGPVCMIPDCECSGEAHP